MSDQRLLGATILFLSLRFFSAIVVDLSPQEAYYWNYARHPALSYFDHPPMIARVILAGQYLLGQNELGVRIGGFFLSVFSTWLLYALGKSWFSRRAGLWAALLFQLLPLYFVYGLLITPEAPLTFFWLLTLYFISIAVRDDRASAWYVAGAALGLCMLSKYTAIFLVPSTLLFLILDGRYRQWLMKKEPYLALLIAAVFFIPVVLWNAEHDWASFGFQVGDRLSRGSKYPFASVGEFLLLQLAVTSPALLAGLLMISAAPLSLPLHPRRSKWRFAWLFSLPLLGFLLLFSAHSRIKANWTVPAYLALLIVAYPSYRYLRFNSAPRMKVVARYFLVAWLCSLPVLYSIAVYHLTLIIPEFPVFRFTTGWQELSAIVEREARAFEIEGGEKVFLLGLDTHYVAAALSFYTSDERAVFSRNLVGKPALAFEYWRPKIDLAGFQCSRGGRESAQACCA